MELVFYIDFKSLIGIYFLSEWEEIDVMVFEFVMCG